MAPALVAVVLRPVVAVRELVVGDVEHPARRIGQVGLGTVRGVGIEEPCVTRLGRHGHELDAREVVALERLPALADDAAPVVAGGDLEAAVLSRRRVDADQRRADTRRYTKGP